MSYAGACHSFLYTSLKKTIASSPPLFTRTTNSYRLSGLRWSVNGIASDFPGSCPAAGCKGSRGTEPHRAVPLLNLPKRFPGTPTLGPSQDRAVTIAAGVRNRTPSSLSPPSMLYILTLIRCATVRPEPPGADLVVVPASPRDCQAFYEVASRANCRGIRTPEEAILSTVPHVDSPGNCLLRCDGSTPRWELDLQIAGFRGIASCRTPDGATLMANLRNRDAPLPDDVVARWIRHDPVVSAVRGDTITLSFRGAAPCTQSPAAGTP